MAKRLLAPTKAKGNGHVAGARPKPLSEAAQRRAWRTEVDYFEGIRQRLFRDRRYRGKFVAVRGREIVGMGDDWFQLHRQMSAQYPGEVVLIEQAEKEMQKIRLPSVEILR
jgi:hypothetical protein